MRRLSSFIAPSLWVFIGITILLFPIAHKRLFERLPIYLSEIPLLLVSVGVFVSTTLPQMKAWWFQNTTFIRWSSVWVLAAGLTFWWRELPIESLGLMKSFIWLPVLLAWLIIFIGPTLAQHTTLMGYWLLGAWAAAGTAMLAFGNGWVTYDGRLASLYLSPNHLAMLVAPGIFITMYFLTHPYVLGGRWYRAIGIIGLFFLVATLLLTQSYAAIGAVAIVAGVFWLPKILSGQSGHGIVLWCGMAALVSGFFLWGATTEKFTQLMTQDGRSSLDSRMMIWQAAVHIALTTFPLGVGVGQFQTVYLNLQPLFPPYLEWAVPEPHNLIVSIYNATGIIGLLAFGWVMVTVIRGLICIRRMQTVSLEEKDLATLYLSMIWCWLLIGLVDTPYFKNDLAFGWWTLLGLGWVLIVRARRSLT